MEWPEKTYLVNHRLKLVYCPIPKVATSSIKLWFLSELGIPARAYFITPMSKWATTINPKKPQLALPEIRL